MEGKRDRTGEESYNKFGSKMTIVEYRTRRDVDVYFPEYDWTAKDSNYDNFKSGKIKCPYEPRIYNIAYIGEGKYKTHDKNGKSTKAYLTWYDMLKRCYDNKFHEKYTTYKYCEICNEWLNFQNFAKWYYDNYYEIKSQKMHLDKDILCKGNKVYSPENCIFVPEKINTLFVKCDKLRGEYHIGVNYHKRDEIFQANCNVYDFEENKSKTKYLGSYDTPEEAFQAYKQFKENYIKQVADEYKDSIPEKLYNAMYEYAVEIED